MLDATGGSLRDDAPSCAPSVGTEPVEADHGGVVTQLPNVVEFPAVVFGLLRLGALPIFALPPHREHEINYLATHSEAVAYLASDTFGESRADEYQAPARD